MKTIIPIVSLVFSALWTLNDASANETFPEYGYQYFPSCALIWNVEEDIQTELACLADHEIVSESQSGRVALGFRDSTNEAAVEREIVYEDTAPKSVRDFVAWVKTCGRTETCRYDEDVSALLEVIQKIDLGKGNWKHQMSRSRFGPAYETTTYFFLTPDEIIAFRGPPNGRHFREHPGIFKFFIVRDFEQTR